MFHTKVFDDIMTSENLNFDYPKNEKSFWRQTKKHFSLFHNSSIVEIQNKLVKM